DPRRARRPRDATPALLRPGSAGWPVLVPRAAEPRLPVRRAATTLGGHHRARARRHLTARVRVDGVPAARGDAAHRDRVVRGPRLALPVAHAGHGGHGRAGEAWA